MTTEPASRHFYQDADPQMVMSLLMATARPITVADFPDYVQRVVQRADFASATTLERARWFVAAGFSVFPLDHPDAPRAKDPEDIGKVPVVDEWKPFQTITPKDDDLAMWFGNGHPRNIALVTGELSGVVVVDGDSPEALSWMHARLPATPMRTKTGRGEHWFYQHPGTSIRNRARIQTGDPTVKIDIRADGGYVVAPGSTHRTRIMYDALGTWPSIADLPVFDPAWLDTGPTVDDTAVVVEPVPNERSVAHLSDEQLIGRASIVRNAKKFDRLWNGDASLWTGEGAIYPSQSEADAALCALLAYWTQRDAARIDRLFRLSGLMREKWNRRDYRERTIAMAIAKCTTVYLPNDPPPRTAPVTDATDCPVCGRDSCEDQTHAPTRKSSVYTFTSATESATKTPTKPARVDVPAEDLQAFLKRLDTRPEPSWLVPGLIPDEGICLWHGQPRDFKSFCAQEVALALATGRPAFHTARFATSRQIRVAYFTEEDPERLFAARMRWLTAQSGMPPQRYFFPFVRKSLNFDVVDDRLFIVAKLQETQAEVAVFDPVRSFTGLSDKGPADLRPVAQFLRQIQNQTPCKTLILVHHDTKPLAVTSANGQERSRSQKASGGGIFSISDCPVSFSKLEWNKVAVYPEDYKLSGNPKPFEVTFETAEYQGVDGPRFGSWVRPVALTKDERDIQSGATAKKILAFLRSVRGRWLATADVAKGAKTQQSDTGHLLEQLHVQGVVEHCTGDRAKALGRSARAKLWRVNVDQPSLLSNSSEE